MGWKGVGKFIAMYIMHLVAAAACPIRSCTHRLRRRRPPAAPAAPPRPPSAVAGQRRACRPASARAGPAACPVGWGMGGDRAEQRGSAQFAAHMAAGRGGPSFPNPQAKASLEILQLPALLVAMRRCPRVARCRSARRPSQRWSPPGWTTRAADRAEEALECCECKEARSCRQGAGHAPYPSAYRAHISLRLDRLHRHPGLHPCLLPQPCSSAGSNARGQGGQQCLTLVSSRASLQGQHCEPGTR